MSRTTRNKPTGSAYLRSMKHVGYKRMEEQCIGMIDNYPSRHINRIRYKAKEIDPYDDYIVSYYRGQSWHRSNL